MKIPNLDRDPSGETYILQLGLNSLGYGLLLDNWRGYRTEKALELFAQSLKPSRETEENWSTVTASSFADPADVQSFRRCKKEGHSDMYCFRKGDNGIGKWGHETAQDRSPMCALPREIWQRAGKSGGDPVDVMSPQGKIVKGILGDTMPSVANIRNGAGIDLNPAFARLFDFHPPFLLPGFAWRWGD